MKRKVFCSMHRPRRIPPAALLGLLVLAGPALAEEALRPPTGGGQIRGEVTDRNGVPLVGVSIVLSAAGRPDIIYATSTDEEGRYAFNDLVPETYEVQAHGQGVRPVVKPGVRVKPPFRAITDLQMRILEDGAEAARPAAFAGANGATGPVFGSPGALVQSLSVGGAGGASISLAMPFVVEEEPRILLLRGTFVDADGAAVLEGSVTLRRIGHPEDIFYARTDDEGRFQVADIPAGVYDITTRSPGLIPLHLRERALPAQATLNLRLVAPDYPLTFRGFLDDLLPEEIPMPPPEPREVDLLAGAAARDEDAPPGADPAEADAPPEAGSPAEDAPSETDPPEEDGPPEADPDQPAPAQPAVAAPEAPAPAA